MQNKPLLLFASSMIFMLFLLSSCNIPSQDGTLLINSSELNTEIYINNAYEGNTGRDSLRITKKAGNYDVKAVLEGFESQIVNVNLGIDEELRLQFDMVEIMPEQSFEHYILVGRPGEQFFESEIDLLSEYDIVMIEKWHANWNISLHHEAAREIKNRNQDVLVLPYINARYLFFNLQYTDDFNDSWYLRNLTGDIVPFVPAQNKDTGIPNAYYIDLSYPELREWLIGVALKWNEEAPYDGIFFDHATKFAYDDWNRESWNRQLGSDKVDAWNEGLLLLMEEAKAQFPDKLVINNGFSRRIPTSDRNLEQLDYTDGALNEFFCLAEGVRAGNAPEIWNETVQLEDLELFKNLASKNNILLLKANNIRGLDSELETKMARFCSGVYSLVHIPGKVYFKYGYPDYNARFGEIIINAEGHDIMFGDPLGDYYPIGEIYAREYEHGYVFVNLKTENTIIQSPDNIELLYGGSLEKRDYAIAEDILIVGQEAIFAVKV